MPSGRAPGTPAIDCSQPPTPARSRDYRAELWWLTGLRAWRSGGIRDVAPYSEAARLRATGVRRELRVFWKAQESRVRV